MSEVVGVVRVRAAEGKADEVLAALTACSEKTQQEEGCLAYALHQDPADPGHLVLIERWRSQADLDQHNTEPWVADLLAVAGTPGMLSAAPELSFLTPLGIGDPVKGSLAG